MSDNKKNNAEETWDDVYMRANFEDKGQVPTTGTLSRSPDIQPMGTNPIADPNILIDDEHWNKDQAENIYVNLPNYVYLRGLNNGETASNGRFYCYYSPAALLNWPVDPVDPNKGWAKNPLTTSSGSEYVEFSAEPNGRVVTSEPFNWIAEPPPTGDHYCMIGRVVTEEHPNPLPEFGDIDSFASWISQHPNMGWRNVSSIIPSNPISSAIVEYSQGDTGGETILNLKAYNAPIGSAMSFSSGTPGPQPPIAKDPETITNGTLDSVSLTTVIEAGYTTNITFSWYSNGKAPTKGMRIELEAILPVNEKHPLFERGFDLAEYGIPAEAMPKTLGAGPKRGIRLGSFNLINPEKDGTLAFSEEPRTLVVPEEDPALLEVIGVSWKQVHKSIFGTSYTSHGVTVEHEKGTNDAPIETVQMNDQASSKDDPWQTTRLAFNTMTNSGEIQFVVKTKDVPEGCQIDLTDATGEINLGRRTVDNSTQYTATAYAMLDEDFGTELSCQFYLQDKTLPETATLELSIYTRVQEVEGGAGRTRLLGRVTTKLGSQ